MRKSAGFTLIELVIVIVILGILGAVAAPKFINLQGDAYGANVNALKSSIQSAATLGNAKAVMNGYDKKSTISVDNKTFKESSDATVDNENIAFVYGYPAASSLGIIRMLQDIESYTVDATTISGVLTIHPAARDASTTEANKCQVEYTPADENTPASVKEYTEGC